MQVSASYTGASAAVVNQTVAQIVEEQVNGTQGMDYMSSSSDDTGDYSLSVTFDVGTDGDMDSVKVQNNVASATSQLPSEVQQVGVTTRKSTNDMAYMMAFYSPDGTYDRAFMKNYATIYLLDKLKRINGVGDVQVFGSDYAMRVWLNPDKLAELGLTVADVSAAIKEQNVQAPAGTVGAMPVNNGQEKQMSGKIEGRLTTPEEFGNVIIKSSGDGKFVRLKDVAKIEAGAQSESIISKFNGYPSVGFGIKLTSDANAMKTISEVRKIFDEAKETLPPGMEMSTIFDSTDYISTSIEEVLMTFVEALLLYASYLEILRRELVPAMGCTEPIAIAFAAAKARDVLGVLPEAITVTASGNIIKNVKSVIVPNTEGRKGRDSSIWFGAVVRGDFQPIQIGRCTNVQDKRLNVWYYVI